MPSFSIALAWSGFDRDGAFVCEDLFVGAVQLAQRQAVGILRLGIVVVEPHRLPIGFGGVLILPESKARRADVDKCLGPVRPQPRGLSRSLQRLIMAAKQSVAKSRLIPSLGIIRIGLDRLFKIRQRTCVIVPRKLGKALRIEVARRSSVCFSASRR